MKKTVLFFVIMALLLNVCGCMYSRYPNDRADQWYCQELDFTLNVDGRTSELIWNGEIYTVGFASQAGYYLVVLENGQDILGEEDVLFEGRWSFSGKKLVLKISEDNLFDGAYKKLVFVPKE